MRRWTVDELPGRFSGQCFSKHRYPSRRVAQGIRRVMVAQGADPETLRAYRCPVCRHWHLGNTRRGGGPAR